MSRRFSFTTPLTLAIGGCERELQATVTGTFTRGMKPEPWGPSPDPGSPDEFSFDVVTVDLGGVTATLGLVMFDEDQLGALEEEACEAMRASDDDMAEFMGELRRETEELSR